MNTEKFPEIQNKSQEFTNIIIVAKKFLRNTNKFSFFPSAPPILQCSAVQWKPPKTWSVTLAQQPCQNTPHSDHLKAIGHTFQKI